MATIIGSSVPGRILRLFALLTAVVAVGVCTDSPQGPGEAGAGHGQIAVQPVFSNHTGGPAADAALRKAFARVDAFRLVVSSISPERVVADETVEVTPGQESYDLSVEVPLRQAEETFSVVLTALADGLVLFETDRFQVQAVSENLQTSPPPVSPSLSYVGPGADAASVELSPEVLVVGVGGTAGASPTVRNEAGGTIGDVPVGWSVDDGSVAAVDDDGTLTGAADGLTRLTATAPTGVQDAAWVYVVAGSIAFVRDGHVHEASVSSEESEDRTPSTSGASRPAWSHDGSVLVYEAGGLIHRAGGEALVDGAWPAISPDGTKLAVQRGGSVFLANADGSEEVEGPVGSTPRWAPGGEDLIVGGASVERVRADGSGRTTVVAEEGARWPTISGDGRVAWVDGDGGLFVGDGGESLLGEELTAGSRPTWSANGNWLVVEAGSGGLLHVVAPDGSAPPAPLPVGAGSDPAWKGTGFATPPPDVTLESLSPERPVVGQEISIAGGGFDWIIPSNTVVRFPGAEDAMEAPGTDRSRGGAPLPGEIVSVSPTSIATRVPEGVGLGELTVETRTGSATLEFEPALARVRVLAQTESEGPVAGVDVTASADGEELASGSTGDDGVLLLEELPPGPVSVEATAPEGFELVTEVPVELEAEYGVETDLDLLLRGTTRRVVLEPSSPTLEVGETRDVEARGFDSQDNRITEVDESRWRSLISRVSVTGSGFEGTVEGVHPSAESGDAVFEVTLDGVSARGTATVTSFIDGSVSSGSEEAVAGSSVSLVQDGEVLQSAAPDEEGAFEFRFDGLFAGTYTVTIQIPEGFQVEPAQHEVRLGESNPTGSADFRVFVPDDEEVIVHDGDLLIETAQDLADFESAGYTDVTGTVTIRSSPSTALTNLDGMESLQTVEGDLRIENNEALADLDGLRGLETVGGDLQVVNNEDLPDLDGFGLATLREVAGDLKIENNPSLTDVSGLSGLQSVGLGPCDTPDPEIGGCGDLNISDNDDLQTISGLSSLGSIGGGLVITQNDGLTDLPGLSTLSSVGGPLILVHNPALTSLNGLAGLTGSVASVRIAHNDALEFLSGLEGIGGTTHGFLRITDNPALRNVDGLSGLGTVAGSMHVERNDALQDLEGMTSLTTVGEQFWLRNNPSLSSTSNLPSLTDVGSHFRVVQNAGRIVGFPGLESVGETLTIWHVDPDPDEFAGAGGEDEGSETEFTDQPVLEQVGLPQLADVGTAVRVLNNPALVSLDLRSLENQGRVEIVDNTALETVDLSGLLSAGPLLLRSNDLSGDLLLGNLQSVGVWLKVEANPGLGTLDLPALQSVAGHLDIRDNGDLSTLSLPALQTADGFLRIENNDALTTVDPLSSFTAGEKISVVDNELLGAFPELPAGVTSLTGVDVLFNPNLTDLSGFSSVTDLVTDLDITGNASLSDLSPLAGLGSVGVGFRIVDNPNVGDVAARDVADASALSATAGVAILANGRDAFGAVDAGGEHSCGLTADGALFCWGSDASGERGVGGAGRTSSPFPEPVAGGHVFEGVSAGPAATHTCAVDSDGAVWCAGSNSDGQLGNGTLGIGGSSAVPVRVDGSGTTHTFVQVTAGRLHTCALASDGAVWCWGDGAALGDGNNDDVAAPVQVDGSGAPLSFQQIDAGSSHTCGVADNQSQGGSSGEIWCWGLNGSGQLGDGTTDDANTPTRVSGSAYRQVAAGSAHSCALDSDGLALCWGANGSDQLGDGSGSQQENPVSVQDPGWGILEEIAAGAAFTCARDGAGDVYCWGSDASGQLGDGGVGGGSAMPVQVTGGPFSQISAGDAHACAIAGDGAWCWGLNDDGQLGDETTTTRGSPVKVFRP